MNILWLMKCNIIQYIIEPFSRWFDTHRKNYYECCVCNNIISPYFDEAYHNMSVKYDCGWHKIDKQCGWICHHCAEHGYYPVANELTFEEWQIKIVQPNRKRILEKIKQIDREYYNRYFSEEVEEQCV